MQSLTSALILIFVVTCKSVASAPSDSRLSAKVFNYEGPLPIKDEQTGSTINVTDSAVGTGDQSDEEAMCWNLIVEHSAVTFALQNRVLDELESDLKNFKLEDKLRESVDKTTQRMRANMNEALDALKRDAADEFFDALFDTSEDIIHLSASIRDPKLDEGLFLVLVKAVSRLGRNNSALIQEFTEKCSFSNHSPKPRTLESM